MKLTTTDGSTLTKTNVAGDDTASEYLEVYKLIRSGYTCNELGDLLSASDIEDCAMSVYKLNTTIA